MKKIAIHKFMTSILTLLQKSKSKSHSAFFSHFNSFQFKYVDKQF